MKPTASPLAKWQRVHIGAVVKDIKKTMDILSSSLGLGPWQVMERRYEKDEVKVGEGPFAITAAFTDLGPIELELIQVKEGKKQIWSKFLKTRGEGLHHIGFRGVTNMDETVAWLQELGINAAQRAVKKDGGHAYMDDSETGGIVLELSSFQPRP